MTRETLITIIRTAAENSGINFYTGPAYRIIPELKKLPALWLYPITISGSKGCHEGDITYNVNIDIIRKHPGNTHDANETLWQDMEIEALGIFRAVTLDKNVRSVSNTQITPAENSLSTRNEISIHIKMQVEMPYTSPKTENSCI